MTTKEISKIQAKAEVCLMGNVQPVSSEEEARIMLRVILGAVQSSATAEGVLKGAFQYSKNPRVVFMSCSTLAGEYRCIDLVLLTDDEDDDNEAPVKENDTSSLCNPLGTFAYVYNITDPELSELGYIFYEQKGYFVKRIA